MNRFVVQERESVIVQHAIEIHRAEAPGLIRVRRAGSRSLEERRGKGRRDRAGFDQLS